MSPASKPTASPSPLLPAPRTPRARGGRPGAFLPADRHGGIRLFRKYAMAGRLPELPRCFWVEWGRSTRYAPTAASCFAGFYALYAGLIFLIAAGLFLAPRHSIASSISFIGTRRSRAALEASLRFPARARRAFPARRFPIPPSATRSDGRNRGNIVIVSEPLLSHTHRVMKRARASRSNRVPGGAPSGRSGGARCVSPCSPSPTSRCWTSWDRWRSSRGPSRWLRDNGLRRDHAYSVEIIGLKRGAFRTSSGLRLHAERRFSEVGRGLDTLLIAGGLGTDRCLRHRPLLAWIRRQACR